MNKSSFKLICGLFSVAMTAATVSVVSSSTQALENFAKGGTLVVAHQEDFLTLDPAINYTGQAWDVVNAIYNSLLTYKMGTTELKPNLAEHYSLSEDNLTYTFSLHPDIYFHNGRKLTAADVKYSLERTCHPKTASPGAIFYNKIAGYTSFRAGESDGLTGVKVIDDNTVEITLSGLDVNFLYAIEMPFAAPVPQEEVEKWGDDFGSHPVGTGALRLLSWEKGKRLVLERNPDYFNPAFPYVDKVVFEVGQDQELALQRLDKGEIDVAGDRKHLKHNAKKTKAADESLLDIERKLLLQRLGKLKIQKKNLDIRYVAMNTMMAPFDNIAVRRAVNHAINKTKIQKIIDQHGTITNQYIPVSLSNSYSTSYLGYEYDIAKAKTLLTKSGYGDGFNTSLYTRKAHPEAEIAQAIAGDLAKLGIQVEIHEMPNNELLSYVGKKGNAPMSMMRWSADYPDPSNFYYPILGCDGRVEGGFNRAWYCNPEIDQRAKAADEMVEESQHDSRLAIWKQIFFDIQDEAPWVPLYNSNRYLLRSARLTGPEGLFTDPVSGTVFAYDRVAIRQ